MGEPPEIPLSTVVDPSLFILVSASMQAHAQRAAFAAWDAEQESPDLAVFINQIGQRERAARLLLFRS
jgi:hypothetical protein